MSGTSNTRSFIITHEVKLKEIKTEIGYRHGVYRKRVAAGKMSQDEMDYRIAIMEAIQHDYEELLEQRGLFDEVG